MTDMPPTYVVERAHWVPNGAHPPGAPPHPFLVYLLNLRDGDMILAEARKHQELPFENTRVILFPNFAAKTQTRRRSFTEVRKIISYKMLSRVVFVSHIVGWLNFLILCWKLVNGWIPCE